MTAPKRLKVQQIRNVPIPGGMTINEAIALAIRRAKTGRRKVRFEFNGTKFTVGQNSNPEVVYARFEKYSGMFESRFGRPYRRPHGSV